MKLLNFANLVVIVFASQAAQAAKVESINNNKVTIFLETAEDENVQVGDTIQLTDSSGQTKATLRVITNRGLMADTVLVNGLPLKDYVVKMPHMTGTTTPAATAATETVRTKPETVTPAVPVKKFKAAKATKQTEDNVPQSMRAFVDNEPEKMELDRVDDSDERTRSVRREVLDGRNKTANESRIKSSKEPRALQFIRNNWNVSMDILSLAGLFYDYQVFSLLAERRVSTSTSLGFTVNFGIFESNEDQVGNVDRPLVRRTEFGPFARYNFMGDIMASGVFIGGSLKLVQEQWLSTGNFPGASDGGLVATAIVGYQWMIKSITLRGGYQVQFSDMPDSFETAAGTFTRSNQLLTGTANYAVFQFGFMF